MPSTVLRCERLAAYHAAVIASGPALPSTLLLLAALASAPSTAQEPAATRRADLVVYGATSGGITTALAAALHGHSVLLVEPTPRIGGMTTCGLGATDIGNKAAIGGISREFYQRIRAHYADPASWTQERAEEFQGRGHRPGEDAAWTFEPSVALAVFEDLLATQAARITVVTDERLDRSGAGIEFEAGRIVAIRGLSGTRYVGRVFTDATYEGDLLALAGVSYRVGREANAEYGETLNGVQTRNAVYHQFSHPVDPYVVPGDPTSGLLKGVHANGPGSEGHADTHVQAYCFRLCTTDRANNRRPWPQPAGYDAADYELLLRNFDAGDRRVPWHPVWMPNRKTDTNNNFAISTDVIGLSRRWPEADWEERDALFAAHLAYTQGLLWTLANHERVPEKVRAEYQRLGLARDEFVETGNWPPQVYVREGRRMVGEVVISERHCRGLATVDDPVGLGAYGMDSHNVQRYVDADGHARNEGDVQVHGFSPYAIPYRSIRPARGECTNLLVPVAISATHIAFGSARMEPVFMVLGHSAGLAAHLAIERDLAVQDVPYPALRALLDAEQQVVVWQGEVKKLAGLDPKDLAGVVVDDHDAEAVGTWVRSSSVDGFVGMGYAHDNDDPNEVSALRFRITAPETGRYRVELAWQAHANRSARTPVAVRVGPRETLRLVDQRSAPTTDGLFGPVGEATLSKGAQVVVEVRNAGAEGFVVADAARIVPID